MDIFEVVVSFTASILITILLLLAIHRNSEKVLYDKVIKTVMIQNRLTSSKEVLDHFPEIKDIHSKMERIAYLQRDIHSITGGPAPNLSQEGNLKLQQYNHEINVLRETVKDELSKILEIYTSHHPKKLVLK